MTDNTTRALNAAPRSVLGIVEAVTESEYEYTTTRITAKRVYGAARIGEAGVTDVPVDVRIALLAWLDVDRDDVQKYMDRWGK